MRKLLLLRPEPGLSASAERARAQGLEVLCCPLFRIEPVEWAAPDAAQFDALLMTSANAVRCAGAQLDQIRSLPVHAVGQSTALAAQKAGLRVETVGSGNVADLLAELPSTVRLLHLAGEDHHPTDTRQIERRITYRAMPFADPGLPRLSGLVVAVHSPRAATRLGELAKERASTIIAAISKAAASAVGAGWQEVAVAKEPNDKSLLALAASLCHKSDQ
ncbi:MAG TPA: uroporphyrinogen-III synthase [Sphingomicrobium sp.]|nr:uroporphyrinogen-III synthase [Sphingomicrobium sp.]